MTQTLFHMRAGCGGGQALFLRALVHQFRLRFPTVVLTIQGDTDAAWIFSGIRDVNVEVVHSDQVATQVQFQVTFELPAPVFSSGAVQGCPYDGMDQERI